MKTKNLRKLSMTAMVKDSSIRLYIGVNVEEANCENQKAYFSGLWLDEKQRSLEILIYKEPKQTHQL